MELQLDVNDLDNLIFFEAQRAHVLIISRVPSTVVIDRTIIGKWLGEPDKQAPRIGLEQFGQKHVREESNLQTGFEISFWILGEVLQICHRVLLEKKEQK